MMNLGQKVFLVGIYMIKDFESFVVCKNNQKTKELSAFCYFCGVFFLNLFGMPFEYCIFGCALVYIVDILVNLFVYLTNTDGRLIVLLHAAVNFYIISNFL